MRCGSHHRYSTQHRRKLSLQAAQHRARFKNLRQQAGWHAQGLKDLRCPATRAGIHELSGRGVGVFGTKVARHPVVEQIRDGDQRIGGGE